MAGVNALLQLSDECRAFRTIRFTITPPCGLVALAAVSLKRKVAKEVSARFAQSTVPSSLLPLREVPFATHGSKLDVVNSWQIGKLRVGNASSNLPSAWCFALAFQTCSRTLPQQNMEVASRVRSRLEPPFRGEQTSRSSKTVADTTERGKADRRTTNAPELSEYWTPSKMCGQE
ncbi:hypothetical protein BDR04DRAFT_1123811 [Suillus decipiens]|nr:hypothetical protein BDR04DRAFT_1123811 [Suillus decipiens]